VFVLGLLEEVENTFLFEQPGDEVEVCFAKLDAVIADGVGAMQIQPEIGEAAVSEDLFDNLGHGLLLKDPHVEKVIQEPQPRDHFELVSGHPVIPDVEQLGTADVAVDVALGILVEDDGDDDGFGHQRFEIQIGIWTERAQHVAERCGDALGARKALEQERVVAKWRLQPEWPVNLSCRHEMVSESGEARLGIQE